MQGRVEGFELGRVWVSGGYRFSLLNFDREMDLMGLL